MKDTNYQHWPVWQKSMELVLKIYQLTNNFPKSEMFGLTSQMRRCVTSIPANIAEGSRRNSKKELHRFLSIAFGSGAELETFLQIVLSLKFIKSYQFNESYLLLQEVMKMLNVMTKNTR